MRRCTARAHCCMIALLLFHRSSRNAARDPEKIRDVPLYVGERCSFLNVVSKMRLALRGKFGKCCRNSYLRFGISTKILRITQFVLLFEISEMRSTVRRFGECCWHHYLSVSGLASKFQQLYSLFSESPEMRPTLRGRFGKYLCYHCRSVSALTPRFSGPRSEEGLRNY